MDFHQCRKFPPVTATGSLRLFPGLAKRLNPRSDLVSVIPRHPVDLFRIASRDLAKAWLAAACLYPAYQNSAADLSAAPPADFLDSVVAGYSSPVADPVFAADCFVIVGSVVAADLGFAADRFVIAVAAVVLVAAAPSPAGLGLSFGPFCSADSFVVVAAAVSDASSAAQSFSLQSRVVPPRLYRSGPASMLPRNVAPHSANPSTPLHSCAAYPRVLPTFSPGCSGSFPAGWGNGRPATD